MKWLRTDVVLAIHKLQIAEHGGGEGVRNLGMLESALARPRNIASYEAATDIAQLAAAYAYGIARNHPFVDGNKRTSLATTRTFLLINGFSIDASQEEKYLTFLGLAGGSVSEEQLATWFRERLVRVA